ncbi:hypothetical protein PENSPDRAFT_253897 [Peniophora sp. CONT]|nr:hypothetical protein PENSPDRAFT_253897 [Peniophora sp. CONT]
MSDKKTYLISSRREGESEPDTPRERVVIEVPADPTIQPFTFDDNSPHIFPEKDASREHALLAGIMPFLKIDQKDMVEEYTALYQKCLNGTSPDQGPRLIDATFVLMTEQLRLALQPTRNLVDRKIREGLVTGGLIDVYFDIVMREGFLLEHAAIVEAIFDTLADLCLYGRENVLTADALLRRGPQFWEYVWNHKAQLRLQSETELQVIPMVIAYHSTHRLRHGGNSQSNPRPDTFLPQVAIYLFTHAQVRNGMIQCILRPMLFMAKYGHGNIRVPIPEREEFVQQAIIDGAGPDAFLSRMESELKHPPVLGGDFFSSIGTLIHISCSPTMLPYLEGYDPVHLLVSTFDRTYTQGSVLKTSVLEQIFVAIHVHFRVYMDDFLNEMIDSKHCTVTIRGDDAVKLMALSIYILLSTKDKSLVTDIRNNLLKEIREWSATAINIESKACKYTGAPAVLSSMRSGAREDWWPSLRMLQDAPYREGLGAKGHATLLRAWTDFGRLLGLEEDKEKARHEKEARTHCSWRSCVYFKTLAPHELKTCAGCSEVRYCGRECQKSDWTRGGHKKRCKRLK